MGRYGWVRDLPDQRDHAFTVAPAMLAELPPHVDLRPSCPPVYDQGHLGSCTANAIGAAVQFDLHKQAAPDFTPSRLFVYFNERAMEGTIESDAGAQIRDGVKSVAQLGVCPESEWPYDVALFAARPPQQCYADALRTQALRYERVGQSALGIKGALASGVPVIFGFSVYESFETPAVASSGVVPLPHPGESLLGGHAVLAVGYDDASHAFFVRNSWGVAWGQAGYMVMPYAYLTDPALASDLWAIYTVEGGV